MGIKLGIIGTGRIAHRFVPEAGTVSGIQTAIVYNPHISSAEKFVKEFGIKNYTDDWEYFVRTIDAAYVAAPHDTHYEYAKNLLAAGKHVLCEKPICFSGREARELFVMADERNLVLLEAVKTAYCPGFRKLLEVAGSGIIGEVRDVEACFTKLSDSNGRELCSKNYAGSFYELGSYCILPAVKLLGAPKEVFFQSLKCEGKNADGFTKAYLTYDKGFALAKTGLTVKSEGCLIISGTKGYILAESPWWLTKRFEVRFDDPSVKEVHTCPFEGQGLRYEIEAFRDCIEGRGGGNGLEPALATEESVWMAEVMGKYKDFWDL